MVFRLALYLLAPWRTTVYFENQLRNHKAQDRAMGQAPVEKLRSLVLFAPQHGEHSGVPADPNGPFILEDPARASRARGLGSHSD